MRRLSMLEQQWRQAIDDQKKIQKPIEDFLAAINRLLKRKKLKLDNSNQLVVDIGNRGTLNLEELSSGEKQLAILLGETLLQQGATSVYLADEPELSLHVSWQEQLVSSLRGLNPNAQLIFATHSPDIVSEYGSRVIEMEKVLA
jgi:predicted ATP-binding protein involved in virulence